MTLPRCSYVEVVSIVRRWRWRREPIGNASVRANVTHRRFQTTRKNKIIIIVVRVYVRRRRQRRRRRRRRQCYVTLAVGRYRRQCVVVVASSNIGTLEHGVGGGEVTCFTQDNDQRKPVIISFYSLIGIFIRYHSLVRR